MSLAIALAQIQLQSWLMQPSEPWCSNQARNAKYDAERNALLDLVRKHRRISYEEINRLTGLSGRRLGNYVRKLGVERKIVRTDTRGKKYLEVAR